jgi:RNA polymerase-binding transcription factor DksA
VMRHPVVLAGTAPDEADVLRVALALPRIGHSILRPVLGPPCCVGCNTPIAAARRAALPHTRTCVHCQSLHEVTR